MRQDILAGLQREVYRRCQSESNRFGMGCYDHIAAVVRHGALLAERYGADKEIVLIAAWLHDIASITDYSLYELHHIHGAELAYDLLAAYGYPQDRIARVQACIRHHCGSVRLTNNTPEEVCVTDADAISHFDNIPGLFYLAFVTKGLNLEEGRTLVQKKLTRSFQKLSPESARFYQSKWEAVMELLQTTGLPAVGAL